MLHQKFDLTYEIDIDQQIFKSGSNLPIMNHHFESRENQFIVRCSNRFNVSSNIIFFQNHLQFCKLHSPHPTLYNPTFWGQSVWHRKFNNSRKLFFYGAFSPHLRKIKNEYLRFDEKLVYKLSAPRKMNLINNGRRK